MTDKFGCGDYSHYMYVTTQDHSKERKKERLENDIPYSKRELGSDDYSAQ